MMLIFGDTGRPGVWIIYGVFRLFKVKNATKKV